MRRTPKIELARNASDWAIRETLRAERYHHAGDYLKAKQLYEKVLQRKPKCWPAVFNYAVLAHQLCFHDIAIANLERVTKAFPGNVEAWYNLGTILQVVNRYTDSVEALESSVALDQHHAASWVNLGNARLGLGDTEGAEAAYQKAMACEPENYEALYNRAHYLVMSGKWLAGWRCYEARWSIPGFATMNLVTVDPDQPEIPVPWQGETLSGKRLVVSGEQGWGDDLMCLRYADTLRRLGATVTWALREGLVRLARLTVAPDAVIALSDPLPPADYLVSTMTLHQRLGTTVDNVPLADGYLRAA